MNTRTATHAGSWYSTSRSELDSELSGWLAQSGTPSSLACKAIIAPHAGYSYSGPPAAWAYSAIDPANFKRVFILGPSHHLYLNECALSQCESYATPLGPLPLDLSTIAQLQATGKFDLMDTQTDEDEHSIEMHLPYVRKVFEGRHVEIVPVLVGAIDEEAERAYGQLLAPYLRDEETLFVVSSDFCHWGTRFRYTHYHPPGAGSFVSLGRDSTAVDPNHPIHKSINELDHAGMSAIEFSPSGKAGDSHEAFSKYLKETKNTICGRHPIGVLLATIAALEREGGEWEGARLEWTRYEQSSACVSVRDSSVSYASAVVSK